MTPLCEYQNRRALPTRHGAELQARLTAADPWHIVQIIVGHPPSVHDRARQFVYGGERHV